MFVPSSIPSPHDALGSDESNPAVVVGKPRSSAMPEGLDGSLNDITHSMGDAGIAARLVEVRGWLAEDLEDLEATIARMGQDELAPARHLLGCPGKRVRPLCVMLAAHLGGRGLDATTRDFAAAGELVHAATLLHDDVIDEGTRRRGAPAARVLFGNAATVLAGDHLLVQALRLVESRGYPRVMMRLLDTIGCMVRAEVKQLESRGQVHADEGAYLEIISGKTASLFGWCLEAGATVGKLPPDAIQGLVRAGTALGLAFQLVDDVIDFNADPTASGKEALADLREGKMTLPLLKAMESRPELAAEIQELLTLEAAPPERLSRVVTQVHECGALDKARFFAQSKTAEAIREVRRLPESQARAALETVIYAIAQRGA